MVFKIYEDVAEDFVDEVDDGDLDSIEGSVDDLHVALGFADQVFDDVEQEEGHHQQDNQDQVGEVGRVFVESVFEELALGLFASELVNFIISFELSTDHLLQVRVIVNVL